MNVQLYLTTVSFVFIFVLMVSLVMVRESTKKMMRERIKLDITIKQMRDSEKNIATMLEQYNLEPGVSIWKLADVLNVRKGGVEEGISDFAHLSEPDEYGKSTVTFQRGLSKEEQKFYFAHECAHKLNQDFIPATRPTGRNKPIVEQLADYTAAALIMPLEEVYHYLVENRYQTVSARKRTSLVRGLCKKYEVSEIIALRRIHEVYCLKGN